jgi:hypothetical protein
MRHLGRKAGKLAALALILVLVVILPSTPRLEASGSFPNRTWYFHAENEGLSWSPTLFMNESLPEIHSAGPAPYGAVGGLSMGLCIPGCQTSLVFPLSPSYPYGFDIEPGTASVELWASAVNASQANYGHNDFMGATAQLKLNLTSSTGRTIATTASPLVLPASSYSVLTWTQDSITFEIPAYPIPASSSVSLNMTWTNPTGGYNIIFGLNTDVHPSSLSVPANYYSTSISLGTDSHTGNGTLQSPYIVRIGQSIRIRGNVTNLYNESGVSGALVTITLVQFTTQPQSFVLATVSTSASGQYSYDWSPQSTTLLGVYAVFASWPGSHYFAGNVTQHIVAPYAGPYTTIAVEKALTSLSILLGASAAAPGSSVDIHGNLTGIRGPIIGADVVISFRVPGSDAWTTITSAKTDSSGTFAAVWILQATGNFTIQANWAGNDVQDTGYATAFLMSVAQGANSIWVGSATVISGLSFDSGTRILSFNLSPPAVAGSMVTIYVPKTLADLTQKVQLKVGDTFVAYTVEDANAAWLVSFSLPSDSSSLLQVVFGPLATTGSNGSVPTVFLEIGALLLAAAVAGAVMLFWNRRTKRITSLRSSSGPNTSAVAILLRLTVFESLHFPPLRL